MKKKKGVRVTCISFEKVSTISIILSLISQSVIRIHNKTVEIAFLYGTREKALLAK